MVKVKKCCCPEFLTQDFPLHLENQIMSKGGYKIFDEGGMYYVSFAVVEWVDVFTRKDYRDIVIESLQYYQKKGLE